MVVGGYNDGHGLHSVEIISSDPKTTCSNRIRRLWPDLSADERFKVLKGQGMVGAFTKRAAIVCGGSGVDSSSITNECFEYDPEMNG
jgi:hypothetical protein